MRKVGAVLCGALLNVVLKLAFLEYAGVFGE